MRHLGFFLFALLLLITTGASAQVRHVVFDIDGLLVQSVPQKNIPKFANKYRVITATNNGRTFSYYIQPHAAELLTKLQEEDEVLIHFATRGEASFAREILGKIENQHGSTILGMIEGKASQVLTKDDLENNKIDLKKISTDLKQIVYVTVIPDQLLAAQKSRELLIGKPLYYFENFDQMKAEKDELVSAGTYNDHKKYFLENQASWYLEQYRLARLFIAIKENHKKGLKSEFASLVKQALTEDPAFVTSIGISYLQDEWEETSVRWSISADKIKITGCAEYNNRTRKLLANVDIKKCLEKFSNKVNFVYNKAKTEILSCSLVDDALNLPIKNLKMSECLNGVSYQALWVGKSRNVCALYTDDLIKIQTSSNDKCAEKHLLINPKNHEPAVVAEFDGFEGMSLAQIFEKPRPTQDEPYRLFFPYDVNEKVGFTYKNCQTSSEGYHIIKHDDNGKLLDECKPDVVYSWGPYKKLQALEGWMGEGNWVDSYRPLFAAFSPITTFGYGDIAIRIKFRKGMRWVKTSESHDHCKQYNDTEKKRTIFYRTYNFSGNEWLLDYTVCSPHPIESWSYGTPEHYDEMVKDYNWIKKKEKENKPREVELYILGDRQWNLQWAYEGIDGYSFDEEIFLNRLQTHLGMVSNKEGNIYFNPTIDPSLKTRKEHFKTRHSIYFNEY
ncbi:MAG: NIF family HAD-type phosphatase [Bacteriovoracaceae bacterium]